MNYNDYPSKGINHKIKIIQNVLEKHLGFIEVDFYGKVEKIPSKDGKSFIPAVYISSKELKDVFYDDRKAPGGNIFFIEEDVNPTKEGLLFTSKVKIVFMLNIDKLFSGTAYKSNSEVHDNCVKLIQKTKAFEIKGLEKGLKNVFKEFNIEKMNFKDSHPYHTFSINGEIKYSFNNN
jgi:hypothetical protein